MNISGSPCDKRDAMAKAAAMDEYVDVLVGDWMSKLNMPTKAYNLSQGVGIGYEETSVEALEPALKDIARKGIKVATNAGTVVTKDLYEVVVKMVNDKGLDLTVAWIKGDAVMDLFVHISTGKTWKEWGFEPGFAQCYLGGMGTATAFKTGADIVICGRVADAYPIIGAAAWWHGWERTDYDKLAQSLIAGHLIECSGYVTGGNLTGFKSLDWEQINNIGYPIAEIARDTGGLVSREKCKEQLLYEIQGMYYLNCDVAAVIDQACFTDIVPNRVRLSGVTGRPPLATTRMDLAALLEKQVEHSFGRARMAKFSLFDISVCGSVPENPRTQNSTIVDVRLFAQTRNAEDLSEKNFIRPALDINMHTYPAATFHTDLRTAVPKLSSTKLKPPTDTIVHPASQPSYEPADPVDSSSFGLIKCVSLGRIVYARACDRTEIDRMEFPNLWAVHFLLHDHLDRGVNCEYDFLRLKYVNIPAALLEKGIL
ncbi:DUF1446-domain-containing protein [Acephala macrosclerotiorum]|nr:DUF1446-domain-containing protein [Acephala macrosclerotiorum]